MEIACFLINRSVDYCIQSFFNCKQYFYIEEMADEEEEQLQSLFGVNSDDEDCSDNDMNITLKYDSYSLSNHCALEKVGNTNVLQLALLNKHHSLWAEFIYNAARLMADIIVLPQADGSNSAIENALPPIVIESSDNCLELGAGAGLPGIMAAVCGARRVVISDYGSDLDLSLIYPIDSNVEYIKRICSSVAELHAVAYTWGYPIYPLTNTTQYYQHTDTSLDLTSYAAYVQSKTSRRVGKGDHHGIMIEDYEKFDKIFLADLVFNRSEHRKLLWTVRECLKPDKGVCYVTFSHHDPSKAALDLNFFTLAEEEFGLRVCKLGEVMRQSYPFRESDGLDEKRGVVHFYTLQI
ncbi:hypothetical protein EON65_02475 [archaeon]|nr:MAG: hypothetical protein EON65_02475 [archaeon]